MIVRVERDNDLVLDLESVTVAGRRYEIDAGTELESEKRDGLGGNQRTAEHVGGGAVYDAIVATTARSAGATLLTLDQRALRTYQLVGAAYTLVT